MACLRLLGQINAGVGDFDWALMSSGSRLLVFPSPETGYVERWDLASVSAVDTTFAPISSDTPFYSAAILPDESIIYYAIRNVSAGQAELRATSPGGSDSLISAYVGSTSVLRPDILAWSDSDATLYSFYEQSASDLALYSVDTSTGALTLLVDETGGDFEFEFGLSVTNDGAVWWITRSTVDFDSNGNPFEVLHRYSPGDGHLTLTLPTYDDDPVHNFVSVLTLGVYFVDPSQVFIANANDGLLYSFGLVSGAVTMTGSDLCGSDFRSDPSYPYGSTNPGESLWSTDYAHTVVVDASGFVWSWAPPQGGWGRRRFGGAGFG